MNLEGLALEELAVLRLEFRCLQWVEGEVAQIFRALDVKLVAVRPMEVDLSAIVRNGCRVGFARGCWLPISPGRLLSGRYFYE